MCSISVIVSVFLRGWMSAGRRCFRAHVLFLVFICAENLWTDEKQKSLLNDRRKGRRLIKYLYLCASQYFANAVVVAA